MSEVPNTVSICETILSEMVRIGEQQGKSLPPLNEQVTLLDSGLDFLCIAILVATLDDRLGIDPFSGDGPAVFPVTIGDFVAAYERAAA